MEIDDDKIEGDKLSVDRRKFPIFMKIRVLEEKSVFILNIYILSMENIRFNV